MQHILREVCLPRRAARNIIHICLSLRVTQMWSRSADFSSCFVLMAFTANTSFFL